MSFDQLTETVTRRLATGSTRRTFLGRMGAAALAIGAVGLGGNAAAAGTRTFTFVNSSGQNILVGSFGPNGTSPLGGGWSMTPGQTRVITVPDTFSGRFWGRTLCSANGVCETGDCGAIACNGGTGVPPATLAEVTLGPGVGVTFDDYDVSLVDGYNLPMTMVPVNGTGQCTPAGCQTDFNATCPPALQKVDNAGHVIGCMSACIAFRTDQFCCSGAFGTPQTCIPTQWPVNYQATGGAGPIRASGFAAQFGTTKETTTDTGGGQDVTSIVNGSWLQFNNIDFGTIAATQFLVRVASGAPAGVSGLVEMRLDSRTNPALASLAVANTGGWQSWTTLALNMSPVTGTHTVFLTFSSGQPAHFVNLNWFEFGH